MESKIDIETKLKNELSFIDGANNTSYIEVNAGVPVIRFNIFKDYEDVNAAFSTRLGGVSSEHLYSMNLSFSRGDKPENVLKNHQLFAGACGYDYQRLVFSDQIHETSIHIVNEEDAGKGIVKTSDIKGIDGLITNVKNIPLMTFYADCVPLIMYDPVKKVIGTAHSGWRGTVKKIGKCMIKKMQEIYGCDPKDIICAIGPSICRKCYEVSRDVIDEIDKAYPADIAATLYDVKANGKYQLDLHKACRMNFIEAGVLSSHISQPDLCTCCNSEILFSHRKSMGMRGNLAAVVMLK